MILRIFSFLVVVFISTFCFPQNEEVKEQPTFLTQELDEVIISATRTLRELSSLPLPAQIVTKKEIQKINALRLNDLLNEQTGLTTVSDFGGGEGIQMQGLDSQYTLILIDGMPLIGRAAGTLDLNRIALGNVKQIEIVKGASSSLYGSEALGGVVNIITDRPKQGMSGSLSHRLGSFNTNDTGLNLGYRKEKIAVSAFINRLKSDGYDLDMADSLNTVEPFQNFTLSSKINYDLSEQTQFLISGRFFDQIQDYVASQDLKGESKIQDWNVHTKVDHKFNAKWEGSLEFYMSQYKATEFLNDQEGDVFDEGFYDQYLIRPEFKAEYNPDEKSNFIGGIGWSHDRLKRTDFSTDPTFNAPYAFIQFDHTPNEHINLILGARFDAHNAYESQFSPKGALRYKINEKIALKASVGYGFKAPDFRQLYFDFTNATIGYTVLGYNAVLTAIPELESQGQIANIVVPLSEFESELSPENSIGINIGADFIPNTKLNIGLNLFRNNIRDLIDTRVIANKTNGQNVFSYYNVNSVFTQGIEFNSTWKPSSLLKISAGYQLLYAKDKDAIKAFEDGEVYARETPSSPSFQLKKSDYFGLYNRSRHMANVKLFYTFKQWKLNTNIRATYRSKFGLYDTNGNNHLDRYDQFISGYSILDVAFNKTLYSNYKIGIGVDNLFNFSDPQNISNIPGRILYGKLNIQF